MRTICRSLASIVAWVALATSVGAQPAPDHAWSRGTTLQGFAGVAVDPATSGAAVGGALGWELTPRFGLEGAGTWFNFGDQYDAFGAGMKLRVRLSGTHKIDPFLHGGAGVYIADFGANHAEEPASGFYQRRMDAEPDALFGHTFSDPALLFGGGVNLYLTRQFALRPNVEAMVVMDGGHSQVMTVVALHAVYLFEDRPVTPSRRR